MKWYEVGEQKCLLGQLQRWGSFIRSAPHPSGPLHGKTASHWVTKWQSRQKALAQSALSPHLVTTSDGNFGASEHCRPSHPRAIHHYEEACLSRVLANTLQHTGAKAFTVSYVFSRGLQIPANASRAGSAKSPIRRKQSSSSDFRARAMLDLSRWSW